MTITVRFTAQLPIKIVKKRKWYIASCPVLDVFSQGETGKIVRKNLTIESSSEMTR